MLTGVGSAYVNQPLYGLPTEHTDEFLANGLGAHYGSQLKKNLIVVSMGTGTSFRPKWRTERFNISGGIGIGGGTIQGLSRLLLKTHDIHHGRNGTKRNSGKHRFTDKGYLQCCPAGTSIECYCIYFSEKQTAIHL